MLAESGFRSSAKNLPYAAPGCLDQVYRAEAPALHWILMTRRLHIGGTIACEGWEVLNAIPAAWVDHVGRAEDLSRFADGTFAEVYASHVLEHLGYQSDLPAALAEWHRVLAPEGRLMVSVPDMDILCELYSRRDLLGPEERFAIMRMMFGGQVDPYDFHYVGLNQELLTSYLVDVGFVEIRRIGDFGLFADCSILRFGGQPISLNLEARKVSAISPPRPELSSMPSLMAHQAGLTTVELVDGTKVIVPDSLESLTSYVLREQGDWFEDEIKFLRRLVQPSDTVVDIGASYGVYVLSLARKVGPTGKLWAFEPGSETAQLLRASSELNGTSWVTVVQQAVTDRDGMAWLLTPGDSELNSLARLEGEAEAQGPGEVIAMTSLDHCLERFGWTTVDLLKIDVEGEEERIIDGGTRFFRQLSPLVMFEVRVGNDLNLELVQRFVDLGYRCFRLIPGLDVLVPFSAEQGVDDSQLNLFAAKPDRAAALAAAGWLLQGEDSAPPSLDEMAASNWWEVLCQLPYARALASAWNRKVQNDMQLANQQALACWSIAQDVERPIVRRYEALKQSYRLLQQQCQAGSSAVLLASLARVALAFGERVQALQASQALLADLAIERQVDPAEPFLCPHPDFDVVKPSGDTKVWLEAAGLFAVEQTCAFSGFFGDDTSLSRLERVLHLGYDLEPLQRRIRLVRSRLNTPRGAADARSSVCDWFTFLSLNDPIRCIDVGAMRLDGEPEPWVRWAQEGCAEVLGFEPVQAECEQLNRRAQVSGNMIRYIPWALGDGLEHTLHITNVPMTSSLFPPAFSTLDLFPALSDLTKVVQQVPVQTRRLDDIQEAASADFLKIDTQGAELMILRHAQQCLESVSVIQCEVEFVELYEGQPLMADVDAFLRSQGFCFLRFSSTMGRPFKPLRRADNPYVAISQTLWSDAIYVRDFRQLNCWSERQLKTAAFILHEAYQAFDLTHLILRELDQRVGSDLASCYLAAVILSNEGAMVVDS